MPKRPLMTMLSTAAMTALAAMSIPVATVDAAPIALKASPVAKAKFVENAYIVRLAELPVVAYDGSINGYAATKPRKGAKIDPNSAKVVNYIRFLQSRQDKVLAGVGGGKKLHSYGYAFNGFAAELSDAQAQKLAQTKGVLSVERSQIHQLVTATTPTFLELDAPGGLWEQLGGTGASGENIIIGVVDGGVWPELPSYSDRTGKNGNATKDGKLSYQQIPGWHGRCVPGEAFTAANCNQKLIGARYYNAGFDGDAGIDARAPWEYNSPRDYGGHGTHTSTTAGGNHNVEMPEPYSAFGNLSGIAPRARIAAYKACWVVDDPTNNGLCPTVDTLAAIDQSVADGVDVINYSIGGSQTNFLDSVEVAFLFAADAGIFVAASAGNSGPDISTVAHPSPWITTVAASTHDRNYEAEVVLGDGRTFVGSSTNQTGAGPAPLVSSVNVGLTSADPTEVQLCYPGTLDPAAVRGKIVFCDRGVIARVDKSLAVAQAGGVGMILANVSPASLNGDFHSVPSVHVDDVVGNEIRPYADAGTGTAEIKPSYFSPAAAPFIASFSSRGPLLAGGGDLLKPDVTAPGVDVLAGVAPPGNGGESYALYSGTSMSSPHVAGLAALLKDLHPDWSPMMIKSALMTTSYDVLDDTSTASKMFRQGAGHVKPNSAADPGLVFDSGFNNWLGFLCGTGQLQASYCPSIGIDPSDLNVPSIAIGDLVGSQTVKRTVKNVGGASETYTPSVSGMIGIDVEINPASITVQPGQSATFEVTFTRKAAPLGSYAAGHLTWSGNRGHAVRIPMAVRPIELSAPSEVTGTGISGSLDFNVKFGFGGNYTAGAHGLVPAVQTAGNVLDDPSDTFEPFGPGTTLHMVTVPAGQAYARFSLFDDYTDGNDDLDLYVFYPTGVFAGGSGSGTSEEQVNVLFPPAGDYYVFVHGWQTDGPDANYTLFSWSFSATPGSTNMTVTAPSSVSTGENATVEIDWFGLDSGTKYLGGVSHSSDGALKGLTVVGIETD